MDNITIRESDLLASISNIQASYDLISKNLNDASSMISKISSSVEGEIGDSIKNKYTIFEDQYDMFLSNLQTYIDDFKKLLESFKQEQSSISISEISKEEGGELVNVNY